MGTVGSGADERYVVISADGHAGADIADYRPYLEAKWHAEFDEWAATFENPYDDLEGDLGGRNWDSARRLSDLEIDGIVAEVIYPNTIPPFYPKTSLTAQPPAITANDAERRWAGLKAHNRWLVDFCNDTPGRRAGVVQINLLDIPGSIEEMRRAKDSGLFGGVLLPGTPPGLGVPQLHDECYEPLWQACEELEMPVNHHTGSAAPPMGPNPEDTIMFLLEVSWYAHRALYQLMIGGALERHPNLQLVFTEQGTAWVPDELTRLDYFFGRLGSGDGSQESVWGAEVMDKLTLTPSEYWARQCHLGASFIRQHEVGARDRVGTHRIMWGCDYPHLEASTPYSREQLRFAFEGLTKTEIEMMTCDNAAALYGFDVDALRPVAAQFGPLVSEISTPLAPRTLAVEAIKSPGFMGYEFATD
jgi:predicted TIM-barrel fold metal-dependent hydrolase